jgi:hypothetical protein
MAFIRITRTPPGEAPASVRDAWVGLELPLLRKGPGHYLVSGVLSGPRTAIQKALHVLTFRFTVNTGFAVSARSAIEELERSRPTAARWWRENAPHLLHGRRYFVFPAECCERVQ